MRFQRIAGKFCRKGLSPGLAMPYHAALGLLAFGKIARTNASLLEFVPVGITRLPRRSRTKNMSESHIETNERA